MDLNEVKRMIEDAIPGAEAVIQDMGGGDHLAAHVQAPQFEGMSLIEQHRLVQEPCKAAMEDGRIHALSIKTYVPKQEARANK